MTADERRSILKSDLQIITAVHDKYLDQLLLTAEQLIAREGIKDLSDSAEDEQLRIMYAAYLYRKRASDNPSMPRMLRWALNNRLFGQKKEVSDAVG